MKICCANAARAAKAAMTAMTTIVAIAAKDSEGHELRDISKDSLWIPPTISFRFLTIPFGLPFDFLKHSFGFLKISSIPI